MRISSVLAIMAVAVLVTAARTSAQDKAGDTHRNRLATVTLDGSAPVKGRLLDLTPETIALLVDGKRVEIPMTTVDVVTVGGDPVGDGAAIGGAVLGVWCALVCGQGLRSGGEYALAVAFNTGLGALIGAGIDAAHSDQTTVYRRKDAAKAAVLRPAVAVTWRF